MPLPDSLSREEAEAWLDELLEGPLGPIFTLHSEYRTETRVVSKDEILRALKRGKVDQDPERDSETGDWKTRVSAKIADVDLSVPVAIGEERPGRVRVWVLTVIARDI